jgi:hypothetical protein
MARIEYTINLENGNTTIVTAVQRLDPGDEVVMITKTPNTALQFNTVSPFDAPANGKIYMLPREGSPSQTLKVARSIDLSKESKEVVQCGESFGSGNFKAWAGVGISPGGGVNNR